MDITLGVEKYDRAERRLTICHYIKLMWIYNHFYSELIIFFKKKEQCPTSE